MLAPGRHTGQCVSVARDDDPTWEALTAEAERLTALSTDTVQVWAMRRGVVHVREGLDAGDNWVHGLEEPVRWRWRWSRRWHDLQPVGSAASTIETFMRERPDLRA